MCAKEEEEGGGGRVKLRGKLESFNVLARGGVIMRQFSDALGVSPRARLVYRQVSAKIHLPAGLFPAAL